MLLKLYGLFMKNRLGKIVLGIDESKAVAAIQVRTDGNCPELMVLKVMRSENIQWLFTSWNGQELAIFCV